MSTKCKVGGVRGHEKKRGGGVGVGVHGIGVRDGQVGGRRTAPKQCYNDNVDGDDMTTLTMMPRMRKGVKKKGGRTREGSCICPAGARSTFYVHRTRSGSANANANGNAMSCSSVVTGVSMTISMYYHRRPRHTPIRDEP